MAKTVPAGRSNLFQSAIHHSRGELHQVISENHAELVFLHPDHPSSDHHTRMEEFHHATALSEHKKAGKMTNKATAALN